MSNPNLIRSQWDLCNIIWKRISKWKHDKQRKEPVLIKQCRERKKFVIQNMINWPKKIWSSYFSISKVNFNNLEQLKIKPVYGMWVFENL